LGGQRHAPAVLPSRKRPGTLCYRKLGEPQGRSERVRKILPPTGFDRPAGSESVYRLLLPVLQKYQRTKLYCRPYTGLLRSHNCKYSGLCHSCGIYGMCIFSSLWRARKIRSIPSQRIKNPKTPGRFYIGLSTGEFYEHFFSALYGYLSYVMCFSVHISILTVLIVCLAYKRFRHHHPTNKRHSLLLSTVLRRGLLYFSGLSLSVSHSLSLSV